MQSMRRFDAASRIKRCFSVRYRTESEFASWTFNEQRDSMAANSAQLTEPIPHTFAQFPAGKSWLTILEHARRLPDAERVSRFDEGEDKTWVAFDLRRYHFTVVDDGYLRVAITVDDGASDSTLLHHVHEHFSALLSPELAD